MPLFAVHALDTEGALPRRLEHYSAHRSFIETDQSYGVSILISGPLQSDDGDTMIGSLFIIDAPGRAVIEAFTNADPFMLEGVWGHVTITRFHRRRG
jgi:uncharacterized protein YciI